MTREEAKEALSVLKIYDNQWLREAIDMAIEALMQESRKVTQESTQDQISRQDAIDALMNDSDWADAIPTIKSLPSADRPTEWIPVSEKLPSKAEHRDDMVLVCYGNGSIRFNTYMNGWVQGFPIAWMPLPEPYREESEVGE